MTEPKMNASHLPPMPDPATGEPRPPRAPVKDGWSPEERAPLEAASPPKIPEGASPLLEWHGSNRKMRLQMTAVLMGIMIVVLIINAGGFAWAKVWWLWAVVVGFPLFAYWASNPRAFAGVDWVAGGRGFVKTYDLVEVKVQRTVAWNVLFKDRHGGRTEVSIYTLQKNRDLWDLVYNGIRHSVANGAEANDRAREWFQL